MRQNGAALNAAFSYSPYASPPTYKRHCPPKGNESGQRVASNKVFLVGGKRVT
jgi:hypothetical protein